MSFEPNTEVTEYIGRQSAWHRIGNVKGDYVTRQDIDKIVYEVKKEQLELNGKKVPAWGLFETKTESFISPCGESYEIHQIPVILDIMDNLIDVANVGSKYETGGVLGNYAKFWALVDIRQSIRVGKDDIIKQYLLGTTSFDGKIATTFMETDERPVCWNTLKRALSRKVAEKLKVRHTKNSQGRLVDAGEALMAVKDDFKSFGERLAFLNTRMIVGGLEKTKGLLSLIIEKQGESEAESKRYNNILDEVLSLYESNDNNAFPDQRGTPYNLLNAITNYVDHHRSTRRTNGMTEEYSRAVSATMGSGADLKTKAFDVLFQYANSPNSVAKPQNKTIIGYTGGEAKTPLLDSILAN